MNSLKEYTKFLIIKVILLFYLLKALYYLLFLNTGTAYKAYLASDNIIGGYII